MKRQIIYGTSAESEDTTRMVVWAERILSSEFAPDAQAIGIEAEGELRAACIFEGFTGYDCRVHIATAGTGRDLTKDYFIACFSYPFIQLGLSRLTGLVPSQNDQALRFDLHLGFQVEGRLREALPGQDIVVLGMLRRECRFIPRQYRM
jgi:RimJ/RimL family protein N-acetyltransferase